MDERANISSGMLRAVMLLGPRSSVVLSLSLSSLLFVTASPFSSILPLSLVVSFRPVSLSFVLFSLSLSFFLPLFVSLFSSSRRTCLLEGLELAGGHYGGYSVGFSRLSKAHERVCPPRVKELPREQVHLLLRLSSSSSLFLLSPFLTAPRTANPPYAPSGSYLRVLLIFSYYRRGHVGMFHTHTHTYTHLRIQLVRTRDTVHLEVHRTPSVILSAVPYVPLVSPLGASLRYSNM